MLKWDEQKAKINDDKHGVHFEEAASIFLDPRALSIYDEKHSQTEDRWLTMGISRAGRLLVVCHTFQDERADSVAIRIFSSRRATPNEAKAYRS